MTEPATTTTCTALISAVSLTTLFPGLDASVVLGALSGATLLIVGQKELSRFKSILLFFTSFFIGILFADLMTALICNFFPQYLSDKTPLSFGAFIVSILATQVLLMILDQDLATLIKVIKGE